jgi:hypothetical protein
MIREIIMTFGVLIAAILLYFILRRTMRTFRSLNSKCYPRFVYNNVKVDELGIPIFVYHSIANNNTPDFVTLAEFKRHMEYLADNNYQTLSADELHGHLVYGKPVPKKSVVITFDDGRATLWTIAFPILKKYNFKAVSFIVPSMMSEASVRPNLEDYKKKGREVSLTELMNADISDMPAITWEEAKVMHASGQVDFQSHTLEHTLIYYTPEVVDFINPTFSFGCNNSKVPVIRYGDNDRLHYKPPLGTPIYRSQPRMSGARRFFDDEGLRSACVDYVDRNGGKALFNKPSWRSELFRFSEKYRQKNDLQ